MSEKIIIKKFTILKKGRKYWSTKIDNKYQAKLIINDITKEFEIGKEYEIQVEDLSISSKYGTQLIFEAVKNVDKNEAPYLIKLETYNNIFVDLARNISGRWDREESIWVFPDIAKDKAEELDYLFNSEKVTVEIYPKENEYIYADQGPVCFRGITIARAGGRDSGASLADNIIMLKGAINSGGSQKNWVTRVEENSIFRLKISRPLLEEVKKLDEFVDEWEYRVIS